MSARILGLGTAVPAHAVTQEEAASLAKQIGAYSERQQQMVDLLYERTRIRHRASVVLESSNGAGVRQSFFAPASHPGDLGPGTRARLERYAVEAPRLAHEACEGALASSGTHPSRITHLVTVSCTGFSAPGVDIRLIKSLGLPAHVERTHVGFMGCHGALNGLRVAGALASQDPAARVLLCAVELCSLHFRYGWDEQTMVANSLFADGAAACVVGSASSGSLRLAATGAAIMPDSEGAMGWTIGDNGFEMRLDPSVPDLIARHLRPWLVHWLGERGLSLGQVGSWALHPGGPRILSSVVSGLGFPEDAAAVSRRILADYGNMSSPTILFILAELRRLAAPRPFVALAFGPGLAAEAALIL